MRGVLAGAAVALGSRGAVAMGADDTIDWAVVQDFAREHGDKRLTPVPPEVHQSRREKREELVAKYGHDPRRLMRIDGNYLYTTWWGIVQRCDHSWDKDYKYYGERG